VTQLRKPLRFDVPARKAGSTEDAVKWASGARTGDPYPFAGLRVIEDGLRFKQKSGGVISKRVRGGEIFARRTDKAENAAKGADAARLVAAITELRRVGKSVSRIEINEAQHVLVRQAGQLLFICALSEGLEFPQAQQE
jgi:hypothetical protein